jgi:hypothetical protein
VGISSSMVQVIQALAVLFVVGFGFAKRKSKVHKKDGAIPLLGKAREGMADH